MLSLHKLDARPLMPMALMAACGLLSIVPAAAQSYSLTKLGILPGGSFSYGNAVNNSGQVAGQSNSDPTGSGNGGNQAATLYSGGTLSGISPAFSSANAINAEGQVTGIAETSAPGADTVYQAYIYSTLNGTSTTTYLPSFGGNFNEGFGINSSGQVVGESAAADQSNRAFLYSNSNLIDVDKILGGGTNFNNSVAYGISNNGKITGSVYGDYAYTYDSNSGAVNFLPSLTDPSSTDPYQGQGSVGYSINDSGQVTGYNVTSAGTEHAVFYGSDGTLTDLTPGLADNASSFGQSINDNGQVVGEIVPGGPFTNPSAFLYSNGALTDLNTLIVPSSGFDLLYATGISDNGYITGYGFSDGHLQGYLLTPVPEAATSMSLGLGLLCLGGLLLRARKRSGQSAA
jgi:probable HAF family extracellular repeat protein